MKRILLEVETSFQDLKFTGMLFTFMISIGSVYTVLLTRALERWRIENWSNLTGFCVRFIRTFDDESKK